MKQSFTILIISIMTFCVTMDAMATINKGNDLINLNMKGKVKSLNVIKYNIVDRFGENINEKAYADLILFNNQGKYKESNHYKSNGSLISKTIYKYDNNGHKNEENFYKSDGSLERKVVLNNDEEIHYQSDGSLSFTTINKYDGKGNKIESVSQSPDGSFYVRWLSFYDNNGNKIESQRYDNDGTMTAKQIFTFNINGNLIEDSWYNWYYGKGALITKIIYEYDDKNNVVKELKYKSNGSLEYSYLYKYVFDKGSNWIKMTTFKDNTPESVTERTIEYY